MPIRLPRTSQPQDPRPFQPAGGVAPTLSIGNAAAGAVRPALQAAGLAAQIYQEQRDREIVTRVSEIDMQRRQADGAVISDYLQAQGKDAVERRSAAMAAISENSRTIRGQIKDREVAGLWQRQDVALTLAAQGELDAHYRQQNKRWQADTQEARASLLVNDLGRVAFGDGYDPATGRLSVEAERTRSAYLDSIGELGGVLGWSPEQIEVARRQADTRAFGQVAESLIRQERFDEASRVLELHGDRIDVGPRDELAQQARGGASRASVANWSTSADLAMHEQNMPFDDRYKEADRLFRDGLATAEQRDALLERIDRRAKQESDRFAAATIDAMTQAESFLSRNPMAGLADLPEKVFKQIEKGGKIPEITKFANELRYTTNPKVLAQVLSLSDETLRAITPAELESKYRGSLDESDMKMLRAMQSRAVGQAKADQIQLLTIQERVREAAAEVLGIPRRGELDDAEAAQFYQFRTKVQELIEVEQQDGKLLGNEGLQKLLDAVKLDVVSVDEWGEDPRVPVLGLSKDQQGKAYVMVGAEQVMLTSIPTSERMTIISKLRAKQQPVTEQVIAELWVQGGRRNPEQDRMRAAQAAEAQRTVDAARPMSPAEQQAAEAERVRAIRQQFPMPARAAGAVQAREAAQEDAQREAARREAERVREIRRIWGTAPTSGGR